MLRGGGHQLSPPVSYFIVNKTNSMVKMGSCRVDILSSRMVKSQQNDIKGACNTEINP